MSRHPGSEYLPQDLLDRCFKRAPRYDEENAFFSEDFEELRDAGYLKLAVPKELGGAGLNLAEVCREQLRLAYYAHATAIGINMHLYWTGVAADLWRAGDKSLEWLLKEAVNGKVMAAGHGESGNDQPLLYSSTNAEIADGGYRLNGHKMFGSLTPVWDYIGLHAMDSSDPDNRKIVHAFVPRDTPGVSVKDTWDTMGMRATSSQDTILDNVFVPDDKIVCVLPSGLAGVNFFGLAIFAWSQATFGTVYVGIAERAFDMTVEGIKKKEVIAMTRSMAHHAGVQHNIAEMAMDLQVANALLESIANDWSNGVDHGGLWGMKLVGAKHRAVEHAWRVVDMALDTIGGFSVYRRAGFERLFRDARFGRIHPSNSMFTREIVAKTALGLDFDEQPRWG